MRLSMWCMIRKMIYDGLEAKKTYAIKTTTSTPTMGRTMVVNCSWILRFSSRRSFFCLYVSVGLFFNWRAIIAEMGYKMLKIFDNRFKINQPVLSNVIDNLIKWIVQLTLIKYKWYSIDRNIYRLFDTDRNCNKQWVSGWDFLQIF